MECSLQRDGDSYVVHGKKWWSSGESKAFLRVEGQRDGFGSVGMNLAVGMRSGQRDRWALWCSQCFGSIQ